MLLKISLTLPLGLISHVEDVEVPELLSDGSSLTIVPDPEELFANSLAKLSLRNENAPDTIPLGNLFQGTRTLCRLLKLIATSVINKSTTAGLPVRCCLMSILDGSKRLWNIVLGILNSHHTSDQQLSYLLDHFFLTLEDLLLPSSHPRFQTSVQRSLHALWAECVADLVNASQETSFSLLSEEIVSVLDRTKGVASIHPKLAFTVYATLQPAMKPLHDPQIAQNAVYKSIQVRNNIL